MSFANCRAIADYIGKGDAASGFTTQETPSRILRQRGGSAYFTESPRHVIYAAQWGYAQ